MPTSGAEASASKDGDVDSNSIVINGASFSATRPPISSIAEKSVGEMEDHVKTEISNNEEGEIPADSSAGKKRKRAASTDNGPNAEGPKGRLRRGQVPRGSLGPGSQPSGKPYVSRDGTHFTDAVARNRCRVFVGNLDKTAATSRNLETIFSAYGRLVDPPHLIKRGRGEKCYAFIQYSNPEDAGKALHRAQGLMIGSLEVDVKPASTDERTPGVKNPAARDQGRKQSSYQERRRIPPMLSAPLQRSAKRADSRNERSGPGSRPDVVVLCLGESNGIYGRNFRRNLERDAWVTTDFQVIRPNTLSTSLGNVEQAGVRFCIIIGQKNQKNNSVNFRDFQNARQSRHEELGAERVVDIIHKNRSSSNNNGNGAQAQRYGRDDNKSFHARTNNPPPMLRPVASNSEQQQNQRPPPRASVRRDHRGSSGNLDMSVNYDNKAQPFLSRQPIFPPDSPRGQHQQFAPQVQHHAPIAPQVQHHAPIAPQVQHHAPVAMHVQHYAPVQPRGQQYTPLVQPPQTQQYAPPQQPTYAPPAAPQPHVQAYEMGQSYGLQHPPTAAPQYAQQQYAVGPTPTPTYAPDPYAAAAANAVAQIAGPTAVYDPAYPTNYPEAGADLIYDPLAQQQYNPGVPGYTF